MSRSPLATARLALLSTAAILASLPACEEHHPLGSDTDAEVSVTDAGAPDAADTIDDTDSPPPASTPDTIVTPTPDAGPTGTTCTLDADKDGFARSTSGAVVLSVCGGLSAGDCDDTSPAIHAGAPERCNDADDDCDGRVDEERDCSVTEKRLQPAASGDRVVSGSDGIVYIYDSAAGSVARLAADDSQVWQTVLGPTTIDAVAMAVDVARGALYVARQIADDKRQGQPFMSVLRLNSSTGAMVWHRILDVQSSPTSMAVAPDGDVFATGVQEPRGGQPAVGVSLLLQLHDSGETARLETSNTIDLFGVAVADDGARAFVGQFDDLDPLPVQLGPCSVGVKQSGIWGPFVMYVKPDGTCGWVKNAEQLGGSSGRPDFTHVAFAPDGAIVIAGSPWSQLSLDGVPLNDPSAADLTADQILTATLDRDGAVRWFRRLPNLGSFNEVGALVAGPQLLLGLTLHQFETHATPGSSSTLVTTMGLLLAIDPVTGMPKWSRDFEKSSLLWSQEISSIASAADGSIRLTTNEAVLRVDPPAR